MVLRESRFGPFYGCVRYPACDATHGAHADGTPLGIPANKETREARIAAHAAFDELWKKATKKGKKSARQKAYAWLREELDLTREECHIGRFDKAMCARVIEVCEDRGRRWLRNIKKK
jgi:ssDNA-binding Zn-finger/Zn-ribbon topoisomerase 1